jgi:hypothetical protein
MVVINHGFEDLCPIGLAQSGDVGFKINHLKAHVPEHASRGGLAAIYPSPVVRDRGVKYRLLVEFP